MTVLTIRFNRDPRWTNYRTEEWVTHRYWLFAFVGNLLIIFLRATYTIDKPAESKLNLQIMELRNYHHM